MKIYIATWMLEVSQGQSLTNVGCRRRLLSFFHTKEKEEEFAHYVRTGKNKKPQS